MISPSNHPILLNIAGRVIVSAILVAQFIPVLDSGPSIFDDPTIMTMVKQEHEDLQHVCTIEAIAFLMSHPIEQANGRLMLLVRPLFYLQYVLFGDDFYSRHVFECVTWLIALQLIYSLAIRVSRSPLAGFLAGLLFVIAAPCGAMIPRVHMSEQIITSLQFAAWLLILRGNRTDHGGRIGYVGRALLLIAAFSLVILSLMLKETAIPIVTALMVYSVLGIWKGPVVRRGYYTGIAAACLVVVAVFVWLILQRAAGGPSFEKYGADQIASVLTNALLWRETFVIGFGPLLYLCFLTTVFRAYGECARGTLSEKSRWKLAVYAHVTTLIAIHAPWPSVLARYAFPAVAMISVVVAVEFSDIWRWSRCVRPHRSNRSSRWLWGFAASVFILWFISPLDPISSPPTAILKAVACTITTFCGVGLFIGTGGLPLGALVSHRDVQVVRYAVAACLLFAIATSPIARLSEIRRGDQFALAKQNGLWEYIVTQIPRGGRCIIVGGRDCVSWDFGWYLANYYDRTDVEFKYRDVLRGNFVPFGTIAEFKALGYIGFLEAWEEKTVEWEKFGDPYNVAGRSLTETTNRFREINGYMLHPGRYVFAKLGIDDLHYLSYARRWPHVSRVVDYGWRIYTPLSERP